MFEVCVEDCGIVDRGDVILEALDGGTEHGKTDDYIEMPHLSNVLAMPRRCHALSHLRQSSGHSVLD